MNDDFKKSKIMLIALIAILFLGAQAFADMGKGYGQHRGMHQGPGWRYGGSGDPGCGVADSLSAEEIKQLDESRTVFFEAAEDLRRKIYQKRLELASELAKENPDAATAAAIQKEVSDFRAQVDQRRLEHRLRVRKINPNLGMGFYGGGHMGPGMMHHAGCGNGPGLMHHGGYGMGVGCGGGHGMMHYGGYGMGASCGRGQGMMRHGGYGMGAGYGKGPNMRGPGGPGRNCPQQYDQGQGAQKSE